VNNVRVRVRACNTVRGFSCLGANQEHIECETRSSEAAVHEADYDAVDPWEADRKEAMRQLYPDYVSDEQKQKPKIMIVHRPNIARYSQRNPGHTAHSVPPRTKSRRGGKPFGPFKNKITDLGEQLAQPPGLSPEVLFGQKLDVDREPLSLPSEVVDIEKQNSKTQSASDEVSVASMAMKSFRRENGKSATKNLEKNHSPRNFSMTTKAAHHSFAKSFPSSHEATSTPISAEDTATATPPTSQDYQTTVTMDNGDEETTSPTSVGITHNEEMDGPTEKLTILPDEISLEAAQSPDSVVLGGEDTATSANNTVTKSPIPRITSTKPSKNKKLPAPLTTETKSSAVIKQHTAKNVLEVINEIQPKPRRVLPNRELRVRPAHRHVPKEDDLSKSIEVGERDEANLRRSEGRTSPSSEKKQRHSGEVLFEKVMEEEDTEKALTMLIERMSAVAAASALQETTDDSEMKEIATSTSATNNLHSGELVHIRIKSRDRTSEDEQQFMQVEGNKNSSQNNGLKRKIFGEKIATPPPVSIDVFKNVESMIYSEDDHGEDIAATATDANREEIEKLKVAIKEMEMKLNSIGEHKPTAEEKAINLNLVPRAPPTTPHPTELPTVVDRSGLRVLAGKQKSAAQWSEWSSWASCFCEKELRTRFCKYDEPYLTKGCAGKSYESRGCTGGTPCPTTTAAPLPPSRDVLQSNLHAQSASKRPYNGYAFQPNPLSLAVKKINVKSKARSQR
uniref:Uncharacterized protein n=1 Tax=Parascaris univalens TaxID=6257 RepID=A0A915BBL3_PARUN